MSLRTILNRLIPIRLKSSKKVIEKKMNNLNDHVPNIKSPPHKKLALFKNSILEGSIGWNNGGQKGQGLVNFMVLMGWGVRSSRALPYIFRSPSPRKPLIISLKRRKRKKNQSMGPPATGQWLHLQNLTVDVGWFKTLYRDAAGPS